jgi:hypothetical protein
MNTHTEHEHKPLQPEQWLVASANSASLSALRKLLSADSRTMMAWRLNHGLLKLIGLDSLPGAVALALAGGAPLVHVHLDEPLVATAVQRRGLSMAAGGGDGATRLRVSKWSGASPETLLAELARPDSWVVLGWLHSVDGQVPPLYAASELPRSKREHEQAFQRWARTEDAANVRRVARELDDLLAKTLAAEAVQEGLASQSEPGEAPLLDWCRPQVSQATPLPREAANDGLVLASAASGRNTSSSSAGETELVRWKQPTSHGPGRRAAAYEARLLVRGASSDAELTLELSLNSTEWEDSTGVQVWLFPSQMRPVLVRLGDTSQAELVDGYYVLSGKLPTLRREVVELLEALPQSRLQLSSENTTTIKR